MFILRCIGKILSIGFILFILFVVSGKSARADCASALGAVAGEYDAVNNVQKSDAVELPAAFLL